MKDQKKPQALLYIVEGRRLQRRPNQRPYRSNQKASIFFLERQEVFIDYFDKNLKLSFSQFNNEKDASIFLTLNKNLNRSNLVGIMSIEDYEKAQLDKNLLPQSTNSKRAVNFADRLRSNQAKDF